MIYLGWSCWFFVCYLQKSLSGLPRAFRDSRDSNRHSPRNHRSTPCWTPPRPLAWLFTVFTPCSYRVATFFPHTFPKGNAFVFIPFFLHFWKAFWSLFEPPDLRFDLLFKAHSWGASFSPKSYKNTQNDLPTFTSMAPKTHLDASKNHSKKRFPKT